MAGAGDEGVDTGAGLCLGTEAAAGTDECNLLSWHGGDPCQRSPDGVEAARNLIGRVRCGYRLPGGVSIIMQVRRDG